MVNLCFDALDLHVIRGRAAETAVARPGAAGVDHATLVEEVAALAGSLRAFGVTDSTSVLVELADEYDELVTFLAVLRLRAVPVLIERVQEGAAEGAAEGTAPGRHPSAATLATRHRPHAIVTSSTWPGHVHRPAAVVYRGPEVVDAEVEVDWDLALRAGRTDPAAAERAPEPPEPAEGATQAGTPAAEAVAYVVGDRTVLLAEVPETGTRMGRHLAGLLGGQVVTLG